ncbi:MAG: hypothetical protein P1V21_27725 [Rhizobiaceae bacterium]|nr:hypothetical protein [Rhizobiaceae bacterium]
MFTYSKEETQLLLEELDRVHISEVREAFLNLVTDAKTRQAYVVRPGKHGHIYDFRYYLKEKWCYAFIPNQNSLLWYFRRPLLNECAVDIVTLQHDFEEVRVTVAKEITVRLKNYDDAQKITNYLI